eukprot:SAG11_NODE_615_length_8197_cov_4.551426_8_plen_82_part_00
MAQGRCGEPGRRTELELAHAGQQPPDSVHAVEVRLPRRLDARHELVGLPRAASIRATVGAAGAQLSVPMQQLLPRKYRDVP